MYQLLFPFVPLSPIMYVWAVSVCCYSLGDQEWKRQGRSFWVKWGWKLTNGSPLTMTSLPQNSESWLCLLPQEVETRDNNREWCFPGVCGLMIHSPCWEIQLWASDSCRVMRHDLLECSWFGSMWALILWRFSRALKNGPHLLNSLYMSYIPQDLWTILNDPKSWRLC